MQVTIEDVVATGDKVVVRNTWRGTHRGSFLGIAATGKAIRVEGIVIWRIESGKLAERWATIDYLNMMRQLDVVSLPHGRRQARPHVPRWQVERRRADEFIDSDSWVLLVHRVYKAKRFKKIPD